MTTRAARIRAELTRQRAARVRELLRDGEPRSLWTIARHLDLSSTAAQGALDWLAEHDELSVTAKISRTDGRPMNQLFALRRPA